MNTFYVAINADRNGKVGVVLAVTQDQLRTIVQTHREGMPLAIEAEQDGQRSVTVYAPLFDFEYTASRPAGATIVRARTVTDTESLLPEPEEEERDPDARERIVRRLHEQLDRLSGVDLEHIADAFGV